MIVATYKQHTGGLYGYFVEETKVFANAKELKEFIDHADELGSPIIVINVWELKDKIEKRLEERELFTNKLTSESESNGDLSQCKYHSSVVCSYNACDNCMFNPKK